MLSLILASVLGVKVTVCIEKSNSSKTLSGWPCNIKLGFIPSTFLKYHHVYHVHERAS